MSISKFITRREPSEISDLGINLNDVAPAENVSPFRQAIKNAVTRVQPKGIMDNAFNTLYGQDTISNLEAQYGLGGSGLPSQARHQAALNELSKNLNIGDFGPGNLFTALAASATEIPDVIRTGDVKESARDIFDNLKGALATDKTKTPAEVYRDIYEGGSNTSGIVRAFKNIPEFFGNLIFTPLGADADIVPTKPEDDLMNYDEFYDMPEEKERKNLLERILEFAPFVGEKSLTGILTDALGGAKNRLTDFRDVIGRRLGPAPFGTSQAAFNALTPSQQRSVASIYGQGGIMQGYNPVSAFGRGPAGAIQNRIDNILGRKAAQTAASRARVRELQQALANVGGDDGGSGSDPTAPGGPQSMGSAQGGAGGRPY